MLSRCSRGFLIYTLSAISLYPVEFAPQSFQEWANLQNTGVAAPRRYAAGGVDEAESTTNPDCVRDFPVQV